MNWYYVERGQQAGPVSEEQLDEMVRSGKVRPDTLVWREGMAAWSPYREAKGGTASAGAAGATAEPTPEAVCAECGKIFPIDETIRYGDARVCAACKPVFLQKLQEGAAINTGALNYAGFWIRFAAKFLDGLILGVVLVVPLILLVVAFASSTASHAAQAGFKPDLSPHAPADAGELIGNFLGLFVQCGFIIAQVLYSTFFLGKYGATPGKMACGLKVVDSDGNKITYGRAFGRACAEILSGLICDIGYIIAGFDNPQKRALHDHICNTRVIYK